MIKPGIGKNLKTNFACCSMMRNNWHLHSSPALLSEAGTWIVIKSMPLISDAFLASLK